MTISTGWGTGYWGTGGWGVGALPPLSIASARATSERTVQVDLTYPASPSSALSLRTWAVTVVDTSQALRVVAVRDVIGAVSFELYLLDKLLDYQVQHRVSAPALLGAQGQLIQAPTSADFSGCVAERAGRTVVSGSDLRNAPPDPNALSGVLVIGSDGDYSLHAGAEMLRKLLLRRLTTSPGAFAHLDPASYGVGLRSKEPLPSADLFRLRALIQQQVMREPEIESASVQLTLDSSTGTLLVELRARTLPGGQDVYVPLAVPSV